MDEKFDQAMEKILGMVRTNMNPDEVMKVSQAAYNLAQAKQTLGFVRLPKSKTGQTGEP